MRRVLLSSRRSPARVLFTFHGSRTFSTAASPVEDSKPYRAKISAILNKPVNNSPPASNAIIHEVPAAFGKYFDQTNIHRTKPNFSIHDIRSGSLVSLQEQEIKEYLPEGFAGSLEKEIELCSNNPHWMIRDSTKILFHLLEAWGKQVKGLPSNQTTTTTTAVTVTNEKTLESIIEIPSLTDRGEWHQSIPRACKYGKDLFSPDMLRSLREDPEHPGFSHLNGKQSFPSRSLEAIQNNFDGKLPSKILLAGDQGVGKSVLLNQLVVEARKKGWLTIFIPNGWDHVQSGDYIEEIPNEYHQHQPHNKDQQLYDNPFMSSAALRNLWYAHKNQLKTLPIQFRNATEKYQVFINDFKAKWSRAESTIDKNEKPSFINMRAIVEDADHILEFDSLDEPLLSSFNIAKFKFNTLEDLLLFGIAFMPTSGSVFLDLIHELREQDQIPILIAIDQYNAWDTDSAFQYEFKPIPGKKLCVPNALGFLSQYKEDINHWGELKNGFCIAATSLHHIAGRKITYDNVRYSIPFYYKVPAFSQLELLSKVSHYLQYSPLKFNMTVNELLAYRIYTGSRGEYVRKLLSNFFTPILMQQSVDEIEAAILIGKRDSAVNIQDFNKIDPSSFLSRYSSGARAKTSDDEEDFLYYKEGEDPFALQAADEAAAKAALSASRGGKSKSAKGARGGGGGGGKTVGKNPGKNTGKVPKKK